MLRLPKKLNRLLPPAGIAVFAIGGVLFVLWATHPSRFTPPPPPPGRFIEAAYAPMDPDCTFRIDRGFWTGMAISPDGSALWLVSDGVGTQNIIARYEIPEHCR